MSGDVQPRKRKDKRRKKEDLVGQEDVPIPTVVPPPQVNEDFNIHVHNDHGTGGGLCAKLVFFILLSALAIFIGSVITQNRGLTDLDTPASESRFANIFSGWIDDSVNSHDDDHYAGVNFEDKHGDVHEDDDEHQLSNEEHHESAEDAHGSEEDVHGSEEDAHESEEENHVSEEDEEENEKDDVDEDQQVKDNGSNEETDSQKDDQDEIENDQSHEDNNVDNDVMDELENASEAPSNVDDTPEESTQEDTFTSKEQEIVEEDSAETNIEDFSEEEVTDNTAGVEELEKEEEVPEVEEDNSSVAVKFGVGVALVVVAHIVLVRKWRSGQQNANKSAKEEVNAEMSRRNTIIPVSTPDQLAQEIQNAEDEYSEEDEEELEEESEEEIITPTHKYMQFRTDYSRPSFAEDIVKQRIDSVKNAEPNVKYYNKKTDDVKQTDDNNDDGDELEEEEEDELEEDNNEEVDEGDGEIGNVEIENDDIEGECHEEMERGGADVKSDEDGEGDDAEEEDSEDISDVDDDELLKKLEARYGKLSNKRFTNADDHDNDDLDVEDKYDSKKSGKLTNIASLTKEKNVLKTDDKLREKLKNAENSLIDDDEE
ncbi:Aspartyl beta-hydroxylase [Carabus blaptoides fortunei]